MNAPAVPTIFAEARRVARALRSAARLRSGADAARFLLDDMAEDMIDRLGFVRHTPARALLIGGGIEGLTAYLS